MFVFNRWTIIHVNNACVAKVTHATCAGIDSTNTRATRTVGLTTEHSTIWMIPYNPNHCEIIIDMVNRSWSNHGRHQLHDRQTLMWWPLTMFELKQQIRTTTTTIKGYLQVVMLAEYVQNIHCWPVLSPHYSWCLESHFSLGWLKPTWNQMKLQNVAIAYLLFTASQNVFLFKQPFFDCIISPDSPILPCLSIIKQLAIISDPTESQSSVECRPSLEELYSCSWE